LTVSHFVVHSLAVSKNPETLPPHYRWNFFAILGDYIGFGLALTFVSVSSVLPAFVGQLTTSAPVIGLVGTVFRGAWLLPQLGAAHLIGDKPKKPYLVAGMSGRVALWIIALALWAGLARYPVAMLVLFFACLALWASTDAVATVAWFDIFARAIPPRRRGRMIGVGQFIGGLAGVGVGVLVGLVLNRYAFPADYALLFALAGVMMALAAIALALIREPPPEEADPHTESKAAGGWLKPLLTDRVFGYLMACRMLVGMVDMAIPFYVGHAEKVLRLPESTVGGFIIAQTVAGVIASPVLGWISERWGARNVIRIGSAAAAIGPLFALAAHLAGGGWLARAYPFVYVALGVVNSSWMLGFFNYMLEIAPPGIRSVYVGLGNTIMGALTLLPMLGGWLLEATSYTTLFGVTAGTVGLGFLLTLWLKPTQPTTPAEDGHTGCTLPPHPTTDGTV